MTSLYDLIGTFFETGESIMSKRPTSEAVHCFAELAGRKKMVNPGHEDEILRLIQAVRDHALAEMLDIAQSEGNVAEVANYANSEISGHGKLVANSTRLRGHPIANRPQALLRAWGHPTRPTK